MKLLFSSLLLFFALLLVFCKKDPPTLNNKIEGNWRVTYYRIDNVVYPDNIKNGIAFKSEGNNKGTIWFAEHRDFANMRDTAIGSYTLDENAKTLQIKWKDVLSPYGVTKDAIYNIDLVVDSLMLGRIEPIHNAIYDTILVKAIRN